MVLEAEVAVSVVMSAVMMARSAECGGGGCGLPGTSSLRKQKLFHYMSLSF